MTSRLTTWRECIQALQAISVVVVSASDDGDKTLSTGGVVVDRGHHRESDDDDGERELTYADADNEPTVGINDSASASDTDDAEDAAGDESDEEFVVDTSDSESESESAAAVRAPQRDVIGRSERVLTLRERRALCVRLYAKYNETVFCSALPADMTIEWSKKLRTTAGLCAFSGRGADRRAARIELSTRVADTSAKVEQTLVHEMCHAAAFIVDGVSAPPHGAAFKKWADTAHRRHRHIVVTTCHSYAIHHRHRYRCECCRALIGRHTASIDVTKKQCRCGGALVYIGVFNADGSAAASRPVNKFAEFVRTYSADVRRVYPQTPNRQRLGILSAAYAQRDTTTNRLNKRFSELLLSP